MDSSDIPFEPRTGVLMEFLTDRPDDSMRKVFYLNGRVWHFLKPGSYDRPVGVRGTANSIFWDGESPTMDLIPTMGPRETQDRSGTISILEPVTWIRDIAVVNPDIVIPGEKLKRARPNSWKKKILTFEAWMETQSNSLGTFDGFIYRDVKHKERVVFPGDGNKSRVQAKLRDYALPSFVVRNDPDQRYVEFRPFTETRVSKAEATLNQRQPIVYPLPIDGFVYAGDNLAFSSPERDELMKEALGV